VKKKKETKHLDVDIIGEQNKTLSEADLLAISDFIKADKEKNKKLKKSVSITKKTSSKKAA
jgi:hypothetical protein